MFEVNPIFRINAYQQENDNQQVNSEEMIKMMTFFKDKPDLLRQFNEMCKNNNINYSNNLTNDEYLKNASEGKIPRRIFNQTEKNKTIIIDSNDATLKRNIKFQISSGNTFNIIAPSNMKVKDLFKHFVTKLGFSEEIIGKDIYFLMNGERFDLNEEREIKQMKIIDNSIILVIDTKGIIGAKKRI